MRLGTGTAPRLALLRSGLVALALCGFAAGPLAPGAPGEPAPPETAASLRAVHPKGAAAAATVSLFTLSGSPAPTRIHAFTADSGRLTLSSPEGIAAPSSPAGVCTQDSATQVSCAPGAITAIVGDLGAGADTLTTDPATEVAIGIRLSGPDSPLRAGGGRDRVLGAAAADLVVGGAGPDRIHGGGGTDVLRGGSGRDVLNGGGSADALYGGGGADKLKGGPGRDLCVGGTGADRGRSCTASKSIP